MSGRWNVSVDRRVCARTGLCAASAPAQFELDETGQSHARAETTAGSDEVMEAAESCPVEAIAISDAETGEPLFPPES
ncbi:ferredoxin [Actinomadura fibrosa]|uniref:Ferredoxin n=1 Tax=Actinomadura fibrosa TaxID=111802 RepID=A0ABW2XU58_9ACTN|nr:ferredoxin [Actinomadura fibrosa]